MSQWRSSVDIDLDSQMSQLSVTEYPQGYYGGSDVPVRPASYDQVSSGYELTTQSHQITPDQMHEQYETNEDGLPVNITHGTVMAVRLAVHIANLPKKVSQKQLTALLKRKRIAIPKHVEFNVDPETKKFKGVAIVHFYDADDAKQAVKILDNYNWEGRTLRVKRARESVPIGCPDSSSNQPMVVNGSTGY
jgi:RNA recognition motif-containing protein